MKTAALFLGLLLASFVAGCRSTMPITKANIAGRYSVEGRNFFANEDLVLHDDSFEWRLKTDALPGPEPISGSFSLSGCRLRFEEPRMPDPERIITERRGRFMMWTPSQYDEFTRTGRTPSDVIYQTR